MTRYLNTLRRFWSASIQAELEYRINLLVAVLTSAGNLVGSVFALWLLYQPGYVPGGWPWHHALLVQGVFAMLAGVMASWLSPNLSRVVEHVQMGTLDFVLLKPIDSQFWLSMRTISPWGLPNIALGLGLIVYAGWTLRLPAAAYVVALLPLALGVLLLYAMWFAIATTGIWFVKIYNATEVLRSVLEAGKYPISTYLPGYQFVFTFVIPVAFLTTVPAEAMLGTLSTGSLLAAALISAIALAATRAFWKFALRFYTSASS